MRKNICIFPIVRFNQNENLTLVRIPSLSVTFKGYYLNFLPSRTVINILSSTSFKIFFPLVLVLTSFCGSIIIALPLN